MQKTSWQEYVDSELLFFKRIFESLGFEIYSEQPHIKGERDLAITGLGLQLYENKREEKVVKAKKLILLGKYTLSDSPYFGTKIVIKCTTDNAGKMEILEERKARENLKKIDFAYHEFMDPDEIYFESNEQYTIRVTQFIEEEVKFTERDTKTQFDLVYRAFVQQEGVHAVTSKHNKQIKKLFKTFDLDMYLKVLSECKKVLVNFLDENIKDSNSRNEEKNLLNNCESDFTKARDRISQYCGFLTHTDFVPHNFRIKKEGEINKIYLLDHSAIIIGNKHDGWARFLNFAILHLPILEKWFVEYFKTNRSREENESLRLMRIYRLFELASLHALIYKNAQMVGNLELKKLSEKRVFFWLHVLKNLYENTEVSKDTIEEYKDTRDSLRSNSEKERQKVLY